MASGFASSADPTAGSSAIWRSGGATSSGSPKHRMLAYRAAEIFTCDEDDLCPVSIDASAGSRGRGRSQGGSSDTSSGMRIAMGNARLEGHQQSSEGSSSRDGRPASGPRSPPRREPRASSRTDDDGSRGQGPTRSDKQSGSPDDGEAAEQQSPPLPGSARSRGREVSSDGTTQRRGSNSVPASVLPDGTRQLVLLSPLFLVRTSADNVWPALMKSRVFLRRMRKYLGIGSIVVVRLALDES